MIDHIAEEDAGQAFHSLIPVRSGKRPHVRGKFIFAGAEKLDLHGVTYGTFAPDPHGLQYPDKKGIERDFARMAANGINAVRVYTVPPFWLLDSALRHGMYVLVGLPWEQHVSFLDDRRRMRSILERIREGVRECAGHPAVLGFALGNEIPASIVRWYGRRRIERFLKRLYRAAKAEDPEALVTYVNYPSTEYLQLSFVDFICCNVYLEEQPRLEAYLARLHNIAGDRPLILGEIGMDSRRNGEDRQAATVAWQVRAALIGGCAGAFVYAWTDEWYRGEAVLDWDFGITSRSRRAKPALAAVRNAFAEGLEPAGLAWPRISVVVCSHNGERTIGECCAGLARLEYPDYEVIIVDDGSRDRTAAIARSHGMRVLSTANQGLSAARNLGLNTASGTIVAYIDDDAYPDPQWLTYLAHTFMQTDYVGVGGPNVPPVGDGAVAECVANAPGGPIHVLLSDREAEHLPGCNMAFRKASLDAIGGFDPQFRVAGDDVDVCWRLQQQGGILGYNPAALVWHHRRSSLRAYRKQQQGYGRAEALLERKWPEKYNAAGHVTWEGRLYGRGLARSLGWRRERITYGMWGSAPFQSAHHTAPGLLPSLLLMPEWHLLSGGLALLCVMGLQWQPLLYALPLLLLTLSASLVQALASAAHARFTDTRRSRLEEFMLRALTAYLHIVQPLARLYGRRWSGAAMRRSSEGALVLPRRHTVTIWSEHWQAPMDWLRAVEATLRNTQATTIRGSDCDRWDLEVRGGVLGATRLCMASEEHGDGKQLLRFRVTPHCSRPLMAIVAILAGLCSVASYDHTWLAAGVLGAAAFLLCRGIAQSCAASNTASVFALQHVELARLELAKTYARMAASKASSEIIPNGAATNRHGNGGSERRYAAQVLAMAPGRTHDLVAE